MIVLWVEVFLNIPLSRSFFYKHSVEENTPDVLQGKRAEVPFGRRKMTAFIVNTYTELPPSVDFPVEKIKALLRIIDNEAIFTTEQVGLALWMERYYLCSRGESLSAMLPSGRRETAAGGFSFADDEAAYDAHSLSDEQKIAVNGILHSPTADLSGERRLSNIHYLYGSTGSGKTEVFLKVAEEKLSEGLGIIYLVPEIGLTHQVIEAVIKRFGETVAVLHSGLTGSQRLEQWRRILHKKARVVIGARSAIFAPVPNLGLVIIDEEHDGSYKSGSSPRYSARQIAMRRCADLKIPLVMGSATPSMEAWAQIESGGIQKHILTKRLSGGKPPVIEAIHLGSGSEGSKTSGCISKRLEDEMRKTLHAGKQVILFLNRRGFTHFFRCNSCNHELTCKNCSVSLTYHKGEGVLRCHYCGWFIKPPSQCPECSSLDILYAGFGTEFIEEEVRAKFPTNCIRRVDTDSLSQKGELQKTLDSFRCGEIDILLGTQMVAKGLNFPNVRLVGVVLADTGLHLPDFRATERTFSLIVQVAGRAGRFFPDGKVLVQTFDPSRPAISYACSGDIEGFYRQELEQRNMLNFPPYSRLIRLVFRSANQSLAQVASEDAFQILSAIVSQFTKTEQTSAFVNDISDASILGPSECPLAKIAANYRYQILLRGKSLFFLQKTTSALLHNYKNSSNVYIEVDVDPISLL